MRLSNQTLAEKYIAWRTFRFLRVSPHTVCSVVLCEEFLL
jgi:hypothetical protein